MASPQSVRNLPKLEGPRRSSARAFDTDMGLPVILNQAPRCPLPLLRPGHGVCKPRTHRRTTTGSAPSTSHTQVPLLIATQRANRTFRRSASRTFVTNNEALNAPFSIVADFLYQFGKGLGDVEARSQRLIRALLKQTGSPTLSLMLRGHLELSVERAT